MDRLFLNLQGDLTLFNDLSIIVNIKVTEQQTHQHTNLL